MGSLALPWRSLLLSACCVTVYLVLLYVVNVVRIQKSHVAVSRIIRFRQKKLCHSKQSTASCIISCRSELVGDVKISTIVLNSLQRRASLE
jgi:hypothetical protein